jgi:hypothetical protein
MISQVRMLVSSFIYTDQFQDNTVEKFRNHIKAITAITGLDETNYYFECKFLHFASS